MSTKEESYFKIILKKTVVSTRF